MRDGLENVHAAGTTGRQQRCQQTRQPRSDDVDGEGAEWHIDGGDERVGCGQRACHAQDRADHNAHHAPERGDDRSLPPHGAPQLTSGHAHGPQQADLSGPFKDRQSQAVGDAHEGDHERQAQQRSDHRKDRIEQALVGLSELGPVLPGHTGIAAHDFGDGDLAAFKQVGLLLRALCFAESWPEIVQARHDSGAKAVVAATEVLLPQSVVDEPVAVDDRVGVDRRHRQRHRLVVGERRRQRVPDSDAEVFGRVDVQCDPGERIAAGDAAGDHSAVHVVLDGVEVRSDDVAAVTVHDHAAECHAVADDAVDDVQIVKVVEDLRGEARRRIKRRCIAANEVVGADGIGEHIGDGVAHRGTHDGDSRHQGDPDHERPCG